MAAPRLRESQLARERSRAGSNRDSRPATKGQHIPAKAPNAKSRWSAEVKAYYKAARESGQSTFYQASDWQHLVLTLDLLNTELARSGGARAAALEVIFRQLSALGMTEGDRRAMRVELEDEVRTVEAAIEQLNDEMAARDAYGDLTS